MWHDQNLKLCSRCQLYFPLDYFPRDRYKKDGRYSICKMCQKERRAEYYFKNREIELEAVKAWNSANREARRAHKHRRRWMMHKNGGSYTKQEWLELKASYGNRCLRCGKTEDEVTLTVDHVIPISMGGRNDISNLQPLCIQCNSHKGSKYIDYRSRVHLQRLCGEDSGQKPLCQAADDDAYEEIV